MRDERWLPPLPLRRLARLVGVAAIVALIAPGTGAVGAERVALVVGNADYEHTTRLANPANDARDMAAMLRRLGFDVVTATDLNREGLFDQIGVFQERARDADVSLFFYAGHGLQVDGTNYLVPVDARLEQKLDVRRRAVELGDVMAAMGGGVNLVFLDACRNNPLAAPLARSMGLSRDAAATRGLAPVRRAVETLIAYATDPGEVAADGAGRNSPFTAALLEHLDTPGLSINDLLTRVKRSVRERTSGRQHPWTHDSLSTIFHFLPPSVAPVRISETVGSVDWAREEWKQIKGTSSAEVLETFIGRHGGSRYADLAKLRLDEIRRSAAGQVFSDALKSGGRGPEMVVILAGRFVMGCDAEGCDARSRPVHEVRIGRPFALGRYEVTFAEWDACVADGGCGDYRPDDWGWGRGSRPVIWVSWEDARSYVHWLSRETGERYRLPSEAEWEYAARAGTTSAYHFGGLSFEICRYDNIIDQDWGGREHWCSDGFGQQTAPVGSYAPNAFGLHDVHGNVSEFVEDCWNQSYEGAPIDGRAWLTGDCKSRVGRGGAYNSLPTRHGRFRFVLNSSQRTYVARGFRVARTLTP